MEYMAAQMDRQIEGAQLRYDAAIEDGLQPAFPVGDYDHMIFNPKSVAETKRQLSGMNLRDYFAAKALQGMLAGDAEWIASEGVAATRAYKMADAMLAARSA
ncbi:hypothetical protein [Pseudomonas sp. A-RE-23]|uniref:hypothetical protein n=1 Tax=Pseudomonas sp. A-RE-23 TaxID=2832376 RepID=UPI001CBBAD53|nr:hypothetical protein [Pseudomonas sp. A-RE-23]